VKRPAVIWSSGGIRVPKLGLEKLSTRCIEAAEVLHDRGIVTAQLRGFTRLGEAGANPLATKKHLSSAKGKFAESPKRRHGCVCGLGSNRLEGSRRILYPVLHSVKPWF
jgi:hypothetical protein